MLDGNNDDDADDDDDCVDDDQFKEMYKHRRMTKRYHNITSINLFSNNFFFPHVLFSFQKVKKHQTIW